MEDAENYHYDGECLAKAEELGYPDIVSIIQKQVQAAAFDNSGRCIPVLRVRSCLP